LQGKFYYTAITPITLYAGQTYMLDGFTSGFSSDGSPGTDRYGVIPTFSVGLDEYATGLPITILGDNSASGVKLPAPVLAT
jgi:hypothetical protein